MDGLCRIAQRTCVDGLRAQQSSDGNMNDKYSTDSTGNYANHTKEQPCLAAQAPNVSQLSCASNLAWKCGHATSHSRVALFAQMHVRMISVLMGSTLCLHAWSSTCLSAWRSHVRKHPIVNEASVTRTNKWEVGCKHVGTETETHLAASFSRTRGILLRW